MCLAVPGQVIDVSRDTLGTPMGRVSYGGVVKDVSLSFLSDTQAGDWVLVHVGFAISKVDEQEARRVFELLAGMEPNEVPG